MDLVDHWVVGFSGKRHLENPEAVRLALRSVLQELRNTIESELVAISSAAIGADLLFATEATQAGMPWICVLPFPEETFFNEHDFPDSDEREAARQKMTEAADCEIVRIPRGPDELNDSTWRRGAFAEAGFRCVDEADIVITVLHDGAAPGKPGGTGDVVTYARAAKCPLIIIDPDTAEVRRENWPTRLHDPFTERLRRLPIGKLSEKERQRLPTPAAIRVAEWRAGFARAARKHVPGIRWGTTAVVVLHALATVITASVFLLLRPGNVDPQKLRYFEAAALLFVVGGFLFLAWLLWKRPQKSAANYRLAAELGRSMLATWSIPTAAAQVVRSVPGEFTHFARNLLLYQQLDPDRRRRPDHLSPDDINKLAIDYSAARIEPQIKYYRDRCARASRAARLFEISSLILSFTAVVTASVLVFGAERNPELWGFAKLCTATAAPVMVSLLMIHEVKRREARYEEMENALKHFGGKIGHVRSMMALRDMIIDIERMLLSECHDWWVLAKANVAA